MTSTAETSPEWMRRASSAASRRDAAPSRSLLLPEDPRDAEAALLGGRARRPAPASRVRRGAARRGADVRQRHRVRRRRDVVGGDLADRARPRRGSRRAGRENVSSSASVTASRASRARCATSSRVMSDMSPGVGTVRRARSLRPVVGGATSSLGPGRRASTRFRPVITLAAAGVGLGGCAGPAAGTIGAAAPDRSGAPAGGARRDRTGARRRRAAPGAGSRRAVTYLLRVVLPDRPGTLGALASALGTEGADILRVDVVERGARVGRRRPRRGPAQLAAPGRAHHGRGVGARGGRRVGAAVLRARWTPPASWSWSRRSPAIRSTG